MSFTPEHEIETVVGDDAVVVRRSPRYFRFMIVGAVVGIVAALILTFSFPAPAGFDALQVFGFLALFFIVFGFALGAVVALIVDRASRAHAKTLVAERIAVYPDSQPLDSAPVEASSAESAAPDGNAAEISLAPPTHADDSER